VQKARTRTHARTHTHTHTQTDQGSHRELSARPKWPPTRLALCCPAATVVVQWCYSDVTVMLQRCYSDVTMVLQWWCFGYTVTCTCVTRNFDARHAPTFSRTSFLASTGNGPLRCRLSTYSKSPAKQQVCEPKERIVCKQQSNGEGSGIVFVFVSFNGEEFYGFRFVVQRYR
jgi:hypothetical protein